MAAIVAIRLTVLQAMIATEVVTAMTVFLDWQAMIPSKVRMVMIP